MFCSYLKNIRYLERFLFFSIFYIYDRTRAYICEFVFIFCSSKIFRFFRKLAIESSTFGKRVKLDFPLRAYKYIFFVPQLFLMKKILLRRRFFLWLKNIFFSVFAAWSAQYFSLYPYDKNVENSSAGGPSFLTCHKISFPRRHTSFQH